MNRLFAILTCWAVLTGAAFAQYTNAVLLTPTNFGGTLLTLPTTFTWTAGTGATNYALWIGTGTQGTHDLTELFVPTTNITVTLPGDGRTIWVRVWSAITNNWQYETNISFVSQYGSQAHISTPANGTHLAVESLNVSWTPGINATNYLLTIGNTNGASDLWSSSGLATTNTVTVPSDGRLLYVRLATALYGITLTEDRTWTAWRKPTLTPSSWLAMDYRAPGLAYTSTNWPTTNTDYSLLWRAIRQVRGEAVGFATAGHYRNGEHQSNSLLSTHFPDSVLTAGTHYNMTNVAYEGGTLFSDTLTNVVAVWTNWGTATTDGTAVTGIGTNIYRWQQILETAPTVVAGGTGYVQDEVVTLEGDGVPGHESAAQYKVSLDDAMIGSVGSVSIWSGSTLGSYETEPTGTLPTANGTGSGLTLAAGGQFQSFVYRGPFTGLVVGTVVKLTDVDTSLVWTGSVVTMSENYTSFQGSNSVGFTSTNSTLDLFGNWTTNEIHHPSWQMPSDPVGPPNRHDDWYPYDLTGCQEGRLLIGPNGLTLWWKRVTHDYSQYASHISPSGSPFWRNIPAINFENCQPPLTNIYAHYVWPCDVTPVYVGVLATITTNNPANVLCMPTAMTANGPRQYFGQPASLVVEQPNNPSIYGSAGFLVVAIGR